MNSKLISVIVPIYNVENYLPTCIDSILSQTYKNLEIILVDDGSPDNCPEICNQYAIKDNRIKVIHKENGGLSSARNAGLEIATGEFVAFVDSDDWLEPDMYSTLMGLLIKYNADIAECAHKINNEQSCTSEDANVVSYGEKTFDSYTTIIKNIVSKERKSGLRFEVWDKLYKRSIIADTYFKCGQIYEDLYFDRIVFKRCSRLVYTSYIGYHYRVNREGSTVTFFNEKKLCKFSEIDEYIKEFENEKKIDIAIDFRFFGCASAIDLYISAKKYGGSKKSINDILNNFKHFARGLQSIPLTYKLFILSPSLYLLLRSFLKRV